MTQQTSQTVRVAFYGTGSFANRTHIPNLLKLEGVQIVALCDANPEALAATAARVPGARAYTDAHEMLRREAFDALYSCVPAYVRTDVEIAAAERGIHIFSEKPQALEIGLAKRIDTAIRRAGVISTVAFRERYRPIFRQARAFLADKAVAHVRFFMVLKLPRPQPGKAAWYHVLEKSGGTALDWGVHAVDYVRFMTGLDIVKAQAFYCQRPAYNLPLSSSFHFLLTNGAPMTMDFIATLGETGRGWGFDFTIFYEGGTLHLADYERLEVDDQVIYRGEAFDPWFEHDRLFIEAVRRRDPGLLVNDYHDGLYSLAPVLAGWESARRGGETLDLAAFMGE